MRFRKHPGPKAGVRNDSRRLVSHLILALVLALLPGVIFPVAATAQRLTDYFVLSYGISGLSQTEVKGDEAFYVSASGDIVCKKDLPVKVTEATVVGRIVALDASGTRQILNPKYVVTISPFPSKAGERFAKTAAVELRFPPGSPSGVYRISGELLEANINSAIGPMDVSRFLPGSKEAGSVFYTAASLPPGMPGGPMVNETPRPLAAAPTLIPTAPPAPAAATPMVQPVVTPISATATPVSTSIAAPDVPRETRTPKPPPAQAPEPQAAGPSSPPAEGIPVPIVLFLVAAALVIGYLLRK